LAGYYEHAKPFENEESAYANNVRNFLTDSVSFSTTSISYYDELMELIADGEYDGVTETKSKISDLASEISNDTNLYDEESQMLDGACSVANSSTIYWDEYDDEIEQDIGDWWNKVTADVSGFVGGFLGALTYNNNNGGWSDANPFAAGGTFGGMVSELASDQH